MLFVTNIRRLLIQLLACGVLCSTTALCFGSIKVFAALAVLLASVSDNSSRPAQPNNGYIFSYSSLDKTKVTEIILPDYGSGYSAALQELWGQQRESAKEYTVTYSGSGMSFGVQRFPPALLEKNSVLIDTRNLNAFKVETVSEGDVTVTVGAGLNWKQIHERIQVETGLKTIPFDTPSSDQITVGGALASNTFSRTTAAGGNFVSGAVQKFTLLNLNDSGQPVRIICSRSAPADSLSNNCFYAVPGSMGGTGLIETVTMSLQTYTNDDVVHTEILKVSKSLGEFVEQHLKYVEDAAEVRRFDQGIYSLVYGNPENLSSGITIGSKKGRKDHRGNCQTCFEDPDFDGAPIMPLYGGSDVQKS